MTRLGWLILMSALAVAAAGAACGRTPARPGPGLGNAGGAPAPAATGDTPYAGLFRDGAQLRYRRHSEDSHYDPGDPAADPDGSVVIREDSVVTCRIEAVTRGAWQAARLDCDDHGVDDDGGALSSLYLAGPDGLWRTFGELPVDDAAAQAAARAAGQVLLPARPAPVDERHEDDEGMTTWRKVSADGDGWCVENGSSGGDSSGDTLCFTPARGLSRISWFFDGGMSREVTLDLE